MESHHKFCRSCHVCKELRLEIIAKGLAGFEELKKYIRQGSDLCKDVAAIVQERAELDREYARGLSKIANKLVKATQNSVGTLSDGWKAVAASIEVESDLHRNLSNSLLEDISKPLKLLVEAQHKLRRPIEAAVDKSLKSLTDKRSEEMKAKKNAYECAKSHEKAEESLKSSKAKEKDINKLEKKQKQLVDSLRKADKHYCESCEKAEVARQEWDFTVSKAGSQLQTLEEERLARMSEYLSQYNSHISVLGPRLTQSCDTLNRSVTAVDLSADIASVAKQRGTGPNTPEQILIDSYAEDKQFTMKPERRKIALQHYLLQLRQSIEREQKGKEGVEKLVGVYTGTPNFADADAQEDARQRLSQVTFILNFLEANHYKLAKYYAELDHSQTPTHKFAKYIEQTRDKQGMNVSILKLPLNLATEGRTGYDVTNVTLGALASDEPFADDDDFDDFSEPASNNYSDRVIGRCRALFAFQGTRDDELTIAEGDIITLYDKQDSNWWDGELHGHRGLVPATYVEEI